MVFMIQRREKSANDGKTWKIKVNNAAIAFTAVIKFRTLIKVKEKSQSCR